MQGWGRRGCEGVWGGGAEEGGYGRGAGRGEGGWGVGGRVEGMRWLGLVLT